MFKKFFKTDLEEKKHPLLKISPDVTGTSIYWVVRKWDGYRYSYVTQTDSQEELEKIVAHLSRPDIYI